MTHKRTTPKIFHRAKELRRALTPGERKLWARVRNHQLEGYGFRRQHAIGPFIVDFCCPRRKIIVELDGRSHADQADYDAMRSEWLKARGWRVWRFNNQDVERNIEGVLQAIIAALQA